MAPTPDWRTIRIRIDRYAQIAERAAAEGRTVSNMADWLLASALGERENGAAAGSRSPSDLTAVRPDPRRK